MTPQQTPDSRTSFESFAKQIGYAIGDDHWLAREGDGYHNATLQLMWESWQESRKGAEQQNAELQKELENRQYEIKYACDRITEHADKARALLNWRNKALELYPAMYSFVDEAIAKAGVK